MSSAKGQDALSSEAVRRVTSRNARLGLASSDWTMMRLAHAEKDLDLSAFLETTKRTATEILATAWQPSNMLVRQSASFRGASVTSEL